MKQQTPRRIILVGAFLWLTLSLILSGGIDRLMPDGTAWQALGASIALGREVEPGRGGTDELLNRPAVNAGLEVEQARRAAKRAEVGTGLEIEQQHRAGKRADVRAGLTIEQEHQAARRAEAGTGFEIEMAAKEAEVKAGLEAEQRHLADKRAEFRAGLAVDRRQRAESRAEVRAGLKVAQQHRIESRAEVQAGLGIGRGERAVERETPAQRAAPVAPATREPQVPRPEPGARGPASRPFTRPQSENRECISRSGYTCPYLVSRAAANSAYAMYWLGVLTYEGSVFPKDEEKGRHWITLADKGRFAPASQWLQDHPKPRR